MALWARRCIAQSHRERSANLIERQSRQALVEHGGDLSNRRLGDLARDLDEDGSHHPALERQYHEQTLTTDADELEAAEDRRREARTEGDAELLRQHTQRLRGAAQHSLDRRRTAGTTDRFRQAL